MPTSSKDSYRPRPDFKRDREPKSSYFTSSSSQGYRDRPDTYFPSSTAKPIPKIKPNFKPSGLLAKESNNIDGVQLKYVAPDDAISSTSDLTKDYYIYVYKKDSKEPTTINLNSKTSHLIGRDAKVCDIITTEESVSKQHAVIQFREVKDDVKAYVMDLDSSNGTVLNKEELPPMRFVELISGDILRFGDGDVDYVVMMA